MSAYSDAVIRRVLAQINDEPAPSNPREDFTLALIDTARADHAEIKARKVNDDRGRNTQPR